MARRVVLAMSGGVDSSVAAHLLKQQGYEVIGLFMRTGAHAENEERRAKTCCSVADALDARAVADRLDIPFFALDFERDFARIMDDFVSEYAVGRTPNPCVLCNVWLKFGKLWSYGKQVGADFVATGHYARIVNDEQGNPRIARAQDPSKDQSYVLFGLRRELLKKVLLPVGGYPKAEIRQMARELDLAGPQQAGQPGNLLHSRRRLPGFRPTPTAGSRQLGDHRGRGRSGAGTAFRESRGSPSVSARDWGSPSASLATWCRSNRRRETVKVGSRTALEREDLEASRFNWQVEPPSEPLECQAQIRAQHRAVRAWAEPLPDQRVRVRFETPQVAVTPGQVVTLYDDDVVLGGGWID